jgi:hypothetical protein
MVLLPVVLLAVTLLTALRQGELESSISAYYGGPVRDVFVGVMIATAACLVAYQGTSLIEDYTLNGAGFYAVFVAFVPSGLAGTLKELKTKPTPDGVTATDHIWSLRWALTTVLCLCGLLLYKEVTKSRRLGKLWGSGTWNQGFVGLTAALLLGFLSLAMVQLWGRPADDVTMNGVGLGPLANVGLERLRIHDLAAILLIGSLAIAVWSHAWPRAVAQKGEVVPQSDLDASKGYKGILAAMLLGPVLVVGIMSAASPDHRVIALEWWEIGLFGVFWFLETRRIGKLTDPAR